MGIITQDQIDDRKTEMDNQFTEGAREPSRRKVICPHCLEEFEVYERE
jgi:hypothetical protein